MFVMEAIYKWSEIVSNANPKDLDNAFINPKAWIGVATEIRQFLRTEMLTDDTDEEPS